MVERYLRHRAGKQPIQPGDRAALKRLLSVLRDAGTIAPGGARQQRATADSLCRRVFAAGLLGVHTFRSALLVLKAREARPGALEIVAHRDVQRAAALAS